MNALQTALVAARAEHVAAVARHRSAETSQVELKAEQSKRIDEIAALESELRSPTADVSLRARRRELIDDMEICALQLDGRKETIAGLEASAKEANRDVSRIGVEIAIQHAAVLAAEMRQHAAALGTRRQRYQAVARLAARLATEVAGSYREPVPGASGEAIDLSRDIDSLLRPTEAVGIVLSDLLSVDLPPAVPAETSTS